MSENLFFLNPGATIGIFAPSSPSPLEEIEQEIQRVEEMGFVVKKPLALPKPQGYLAGSDDERRTSLHSLMADPEVSALMAVRGGYGALRLLKALRPLWHYYPPKPIIGFSDVTVLHMARLAATGIGGWHAPMLCNMSSPGHRKRLKEALLGDLKPWKLKKDSHLTPGRARGRLIGGNLTLLVSLLSTPYWPNSKGAILFLEDHGEDLYRLDRLLTTLRISGRLESLAGLVFGDFGQTKAAQKKIQALLIETAKACPGPAAMVGYFGHGQENRPWPVGGIGELVVGEAKSSLTFVSPKI
ncbi:MAG: LD-carboxypeptidase [Deltaproteobacteria bacterium]|jgi:muramoyltetrapeptide carboxypeptidase|nr:LD-carboxypeptidase [Deltaproteobacteria bacterium]